MNIWMHLRGSVVLRISYEWEVMTKKLWFQLSWLTLGGVCADVHIHLAAQSVLKAQFFLLRAAASIHATVLAVCVYMWCQVRYVLLLLLESLCCCRPQFTGWFVVFLVFHPVAGRFTLTYTKTYILILPLWRLTKTFLLSWAAEPNIGAVTGSFSVTWKWLYNQKNVWASWNSSEVNKCTSMPVEQFKNTFFKLEKQSQEPRRDVWLIAYSKGILL